MSFNRLDAADITISAESTVAPAWSTGATTLASSSFFTSSTETAAEIGNFYHRIFSDSDFTNSEFSISYGNKLGNGDVLFTGNTVSRTSTIYGQWRNLVNGDEDTDFTYTLAGEAFTEEHIYVISVDRARYKEKLFPGSLELKINNVIFHDDSRTEDTVSYSDAGRVYEIFKSGSSVAESGSFGQFLPDVGAIVLYGTQLNGIDSSILNPDSYESTEALANFRESIDHITLQSEETITSNFVFVRVRNSEYNYSTNPSFITGSGELKYDEMINSPQTYITTVGLYNDNNDLLGVAKLSRPLLKDFTKEALIRIKLDY